MNNRSIFTDVTLSKLEDDRLRQIFLETRSKIFKERSNKKRKPILKTLEIDLCYIQRELSIRQQRKIFAKKLHERVSTKR